MQDKELCVYSLNGRPLCLPLRLTSYTSLSTASKSPFAYLLCVCVSKHTSPFWLSELLCELFTKVKTLKTPRLLLYSPSSFTRKRVCACVCGGDKDKRQDGMCGRRIGPLIQITHKSKNQFHLSEPIHHFIAYKSVRTVL